MSDYSSIQQHTRKIFSGEKPKDPLPFVDGENLNMPKGLPLLPDHYLELVDWSSRHLDRRKRDCIAENTLPILERLGISPSTGYTSTEMLKVGLKDWWDQ
ncbi:hypothetical protein BTJ40_08095 [Microbulbifer sp. A4B17]|uniref:hypothetical protein n=1 Tax=Microbulbifer sp. A4B17 TaxID=359370 RepID=UPI000D52B37A|nr:hypothetical protein [Microbulbifer sp. A4B17]AWF80772.1 hypothetical protein BTJ40_08095 [Microbulbifer sp. A4B17]